jgi:hypothetical protein
VLRRGRAHGRRTWCATSRARSMAAIMRSARCQSSLGFTSCCPAVRAAKATGKGIRKIAGELGIGVGTAQRIVG